MIAIGLNLHDVVRTIERSVIWQEVRHWGNAHPQLLALAFVAVVLVAVAGWFRARAHPPPRRRSRGRTGGRRKAVRRN